MFTTIRLRGALGRRFGFVHKCIASSAAQAIRYLQVNYADFDRWVLEASKRGVVFNVSINNAYELEEEEMIDPVPEASTISITPLFSGAGGGNISWFKVILGAGLLVAGLAGLSFLGLGPLQLAITGGLLLVSGLMGRRVDKPEDQDSEKSFIFSGSSNTSSAGGRVPVCYGIMIVGSTVISAAVRSYLV